MKKILAILLCAILICGAFAGCGNTVQDASSDISSVVDTSSDTTSQDTTSKDTFTKPENYATVVKVTINPEFNLYLDENGFVLAVEPLNDDAKTLTIKVTEENKEVKTFVKELVNETKEKGFLKDDATIKVETKDKETFAEKVVAAVESIEQTFKTEATTLGVTVTVEVVDKKDDTSSVDTSSVDISSNDVSSNDVSSNNTSSTNTSSTAPVEIKIEYGKEYYCIVETSKTTIDYLSVKFNKDGTGEYLQSGYQDTNPSAGTEYEYDGTYIEYKSKKYYECAGLGDEFTYKKKDNNITITTSDGRKCELIVVSTDELTATKFDEYYEATPKNAKFSKTDVKLEKPIEKPKETNKNADPSNIKLGVEYLGNFKAEGDSLIAALLQFEDGGVMFGTRYFTKDASAGGSAAITYKGTQYYSEGAGFNGNTFEFDGDEIVIKNPDGSNKDLLRMTLSTDGKLTIVYSATDKDSLLKKGVVLEPDVKKVK